jgi:proteasome lid subunit RPN8/RPN11
MVGAVSAGAFALLVIPQEQWEVMRNSVEKCLPEEACGLLIGSKNLVSEAIPVTNELHSTTRYRMDPAEQLQAFLKIDELDIELLGIYHSHPCGPPTPSETDISEAAYPDAVYVILCPSSSGWRPRGFQIISNEIVEIEIRIDDSN